MKALLGEPEVAYKWLIGQGCHHPGERWQEKVPGWVKVLADRVNMVS